MSNPSTLSRRGFLASAAIAGMALNSFAAPNDKRANSPLICFSKHLQFARDYNELADLLAELKFDGTDLTVRKGGHVLPERVEEDLPKAVEAIRKVGLDVQMFTSDIADPDDGITEKVLKTASSLGIHYYRIGTWIYDKDRDILDQLNEWKPKVKALADMNAHYNLRAGYHNHSGIRQIGGSLWEIREMYSQADPRWVGYNFDAAHAVAEGAGGSWETVFNVVQKQIFGVAVKDALYEKRPDGTWRVGYPPVGEGMVNWPLVLQKLKAISFDGPFSMHFEYPIPGEGDEKRKNELQCIRRDHRHFSTLLNEAGLR